MPENPYEPPKAVVSRRLPILLPLEVLGAWAGLGLIVGVLLGLGIAVGVQAYNPRGVGLERMVMWTAPATGIAGAALLTLLRSLCFCRGQLEEDSL